MVRHACGYVPSHIPCRLFVCPSSASPSYTALFSRVVSHCCLPRCSPLSLPKGSVVGTDSGSKEAVEKGPSSFSLLLGLFPATPLYPLPRCQTLSLMCIITYHTADGHVIFFSLQLIEAHTGHAIANGRCNTYWPRHCSVDVTELILQAWKFWAVSKIRAALC